MEEYLNYIKQYITLSPEAEKEIRSNVEIKNYEKGDQLLQEGRVCERMYFISGGTARIYFYRDGKDITFWVYPQNTIFSSWHSYILRKPALENIEVLDQTEVISLTYDQLEELYAKYPEMERFGRLIAQEQLALIDDFYKEFYFLTAKEKYELLLKYYPSITQRANLGHIASMLGISLETLSRVRAK